jgi:amidase
LPPPRRKRLRDYRIGYVIDDPFCPVDAPVRDVLTRAIEALRSAGAQVEEGWPAGVDPMAQYRLYAWLLAAFFSQTVEDGEFEGMRDAARRTRNPWLEAQTASHRDWLRKSAMRLAARATWQSWFATHDAFLMPVTIVPAFPHDHREMNARVLATSAGPRPYTDLAMWIAFATLTGCPATVAPVGLTADGLPVGLQIMGPYLEDATPIDVARKMAPVVGGFVAPPESS